jgi:hypothetical protein
MFVVTKRTQWLMQRLPAECNALAGHLLWCGCGRCCGWGHHLGPGSEELPKEAGLFDLRLRRGFKRCCSRSALGSLRRLGSWLRDGSRGRGLHLGLRRG